MKFLCDRCNTRYSIGDDRVRGKILKIRCKNCANVITVREGMSADVEPAPAPEPAARAKKSTTVAPAVMHETAASAPSPPVAARAAVPRPAAGPEPSSRVPRAGEPARDRSGAAGSADGDAGRAAARRGAEQGRGGSGAAGGGASNALNAAFASAMAKPPPALEEEWYVSIDGAQEGPLSLPEAQRWVAQKPFDAELHCWSEGFDDWLPVDKVGHFRGLRKRPVPTVARVAPPPRPAAGAPPAPHRSDPNEPGDRSGRGAADPVDTSKPTFAATMASLERGGATPAAARAPAVPAISGATPPRGSAVPARGGPSSQAAPSAARAAFDTSEPPAVEPFRDPILAPRAPSEPGATRGSQATPPKGPSSSDAALTTPHLPASPQEPPPATSATQAPSDGEGAPDGGDGGDGDDDELDIGEVSRVVKLADLVRAPRPTERPAKTGAISRAALASGSLARQTAANPVLRPAASEPADALAAAAPVGEEPDPALALAPAATSHRRGLIALLSFAIVLVLAVIAVVIVFVDPKDDPTGGRLGAVRDIDTSRPDDPITHRPIDTSRPPTTGSATPPAPPTRPLGPRPTTGVSTPPSVSGRDADPPAGGAALRGDEIEDVARKHQDLTQRCYMRAQRGADAILVGEVKKIAVTLSIDRDGNVNDVQLSEHGGDNLGKCLSATIRSWKFRPSTGGSFRFSLNFVSG